MFKKYTNKGMCRHCPALAVTTKSTICLKCIHQRDLLRRRKHYEENHLRINQKRREKSHAARNSNDNHSQ
jgi:hypothetical protein